MNDATQRTDVEFLVPAELRLRPTPNGALQVDTDLAEPVGEIPGELVGLFLLFCRPRSIDDAHADATKEWTIERDEFALLVSQWQAEGLLRTEAQGSTAPSRLAVFRRAFDEFSASGARAFPLRSTLPSQRPRLFYPGLGSREIHRPEDFPWVERLQEAFPAIRAELTALLRDTSPLVQVNRAYTSTGEWAAGHFWIFGERNEAVCDRCPVTAKLVSQVQGPIGTAMFSALAPNTFISPHCGYTSAKLRCQLPLIVPRGCRLKVGDIEVEQEEGRCIVFDDSFLHSAWNDSGSVRYVLLFDFFHPDLGTDEIAYLSGISEKQEFGKPYVEEAKTAPRVEWTRERG